MRGRYILVVMGLAISTNLHSQSPDSLSMNGLDVISQQMEHYEKLIEAGLDVTELTGILEYRLEHPLNINDATVSELEELDILSLIQIKNLLDYRNKYGIFYSIYEINTIEGYGRNTLEKLLPFVRVGAPDEKPIISTKKLRSSHELFLRFQRKLVSQAGFDIPDDSAQLNKSGSFYLGDPNRYYLRYRYRSGKHIGLGITAEKDPGEIFLKPVAGIHPNISDQLKRQYGFDFYSAYLSIKDIGLIHTLIVGDYHAQFGQGLTLWTGLSFSGGGDPAGFKKFAPMVKASTSANESSFLRGFALRLQRKRFDLNLFYSRKKSDASLRISVAGSEASIASLPSSGYHRTLNEILNKNNVVQQYFGGHLSYSAKRIRAGVTAYKSIFNLELIPEERGVRDFRFSGSKNFNAGINVETLFRKTILYGEASISATGGWALLAGITHNTPSGCILAVQYREYRKEYQSLLDGAYGIQDHNANERGIRLALETAVLPDLIIKLYTEHYTYPWLNSLMINRFRGLKNEVSLDYIPVKNSKLTMRFYHKKASAKSSDNKDWFDQALFYTSYKYSIRIRHILSASFSIKSQFDYTNVRSGGIEGDDSRGSLLALDIFYHPTLLPVKLSFRYALFNTDDFSSRLYAYENDVLYASSMPAYYGKGYRSYLLVKYKLSQWLDAWLRLSLTRFTDRNTISSGPAEIEGNKLPEIKIQLRLKL